MTDCIRHDAWDRAYVDHFETFFGDNGVTLRAEARRYGRDICNGTRARGLRTVHAPHNAVAALLAAGCPDLVATQRCRAGASFRNLRGELVPDPLTRRAIARCD